MVFLQVNFLEDLQVGATRERIIKKKVGGCVKPVLRLYDNQIVFIKREFTKVLSKILLDTFGV